ncbi:alkene reductase [Caballeronia mineralivorans]|uniref:alkene reductase n=1 Tax=Caballeronia mineralivorans TaxID=2010198 RepID=UPI002AFEFCA6|nr:alkene reductase [Caballeronia mineralivorans]
MSKLFSPITIGSIPLKHRLVMPPLTRLRSNPDDSVSDMMVEHYAQRASDGGLIITEAANVSIQARGYIGAPGLYLDSHIDGYRRIADAIHEKGGRVVAQIVHCGRTSHNDIAGGSSPVGPSVIPFDAMALTLDGWKPVSPHRAMNLEDIRQTVKDFRDAAQRALDAGVDGVEIHSANGYLLDSFLYDGSNKRTDAYGGSVDNRARFLLEVVEAVSALRGADRIGVRLSPSGEWNDMVDSDPMATFGRVGELLNQFGLAYLHIIEPRIKGDDVKVGHEDMEPVASAHLRKVFNGSIIAAGGFNGDSAEEILQKGDADLVAIGRPFTSNPDLPERLRLKLPLTPYDRSAFWGGTEQSYTDFPRYRELETAGR